MSGIVTKPAEVLWFRMEGRVRVAVVDCPFCDGRHEHVVPVDIFPQAPLRRSARCNGKRGDIQIVIGDDVVTLDENGQVP